jgi:general stress protein YciG
MAGKDKQQGGGDNFANNPDNASEAGKKGGAQGRRALSRPQVAGNSSQW